MSKNKRLDDLERATGGRGGGPENVVIVVDWQEDDEVTSTYIVDGVRMTETEFMRRWPNYKHDPIEVKVDWSE